jgi:peroxin-6
MASPVLLHNLCPPDGPASDATVWLHSLPVRTGKPPIPTATSVTLAIIASPFSCEEPYRSILAESLKSNFEGTARLIKRGDIICVGIDTSALRSVDGLDRGVVEEDAVQSR